MRNHLRSLLWRDYFARSKNRLKLPLLSHCPSRRESGRKTCHDKGCRYGPCKLRWNAGKCGADRWAIKKHLRQKVPSFPYSVLDKSLSMFSIAGGDLHVNRKTSHFHFFSRHFAAIRGIGENFSKTSIQTF